VQGVTEDGDSPMKSSEIYRTERAKVLPEPAAAERAR